MTSSLRELYSPVSFESHKKLSEKTVCGKKIPVPAAFFEHAAIACGLCNGWKARHRYGHCPHFAARLPRKHIACLYKTLETSSPARCELFEPPYVQIVLKFMPCLYIYKTSGEQKIRRGNKTKSARRLRIQSVLDTIRTQYRMPR